MSTVPVRTADVVAIDPEWWNRDLLTGYVPSDLDEERGYWLSLSDVDLEAISSRSVATDP